MNAVDKDGQSVLDYATEAGKFKSAVIPYCNYCYKIVIFSSKLKSGSLQKFGTTNLAPQKVILQTPNLQ